MDSKHIINLQGKEFILFAGLLEIAHEQGLSSINTEVMQLEPVVVIKATVTTSKGTFTGIGDASENNVNRMIAPHKIRMAETRAVARALRFATNIGMTALEELGGEEIKEVKTEPKETVSIKQNDTILNEFNGTEVKNEFICHDCNGKMTEKVYNFSLKKYGEPVCMKCQTERNTPKQIEEPF